MKRISAIREALADIPGALKDFDPDEGHEGSQPGVVSHAVWRPSEEALDREIAVPSGGDDATDDLDSDPGDFDPVFELGPDAEEKIAALGKAIGSSMRRSFEIKGMDAHGYYLPYHARGIQWGVHVRVSGIATLVHDVMAPLQTDALTKTRLAFYAIAQHELFHFSTEYAIGQAELTQQQAWWVPANQHFRAGVPPYHAREEKLANAWMLKTFRTALPAYRVRGKQEALKGFVKQQPVGYRDAFGVRTPEDWQRELRLLMRDKAEAAGRLADNPRLWHPDAMDWPAVFPIRPRIDWRHCPIFLANDTEIFGVPFDWLHYFTRIPDIEEEQGFQTQLARLDLQVRKAWVRVKARLREHITSGCDFKRWPKDGPDAWSTRVNDKFRAHLRQDRAAGRWIAYAIGGHKEMGHG
jgi:hypothetical protein